MENKFLVNCWLEGYLDSEVPGQFIIENFYDKTQFGITNPSILKIINYCVAEKTSEQIVNYAAEILKYEEKETKELISFLLKKKIIVPSKSKYYKTKKNTSRWTELGWEDALDYYVAIRDYPFLDYSKSEAFFHDKNKMAEYLGQEPLPPIYKTYENSIKIALDDKTPRIKDTSAQNILTQLRPTKTQNKPLSRSVISELLYTTFGKVGEIIGKTQGVRLLKTSPSGGARHPTEAYLITLNAGIKNGLYHYSVKENALEYIRNGIKVDELKSMLYGLDEIEFDPKIIIIMSEMFDRSMWRYREYRSYRAVMHDVGHLYETIKLVSFANNLNVFSGFGFDDTKLENFLGINSEKESGIRFVAIG